MSRLDRYTTAVLLAQLIAENPADQDELLLQQAFDDIRDELAAYRRNQAEFPAHMEAALQQIRSVFDPHSRRVPQLRLVTEEQFELLAYPNGRGDT